MESGLMSKKWSRKRCDMNSKKELELDNQALKYLVGRLETLVGKIETTVQREKDRKLERLKMYEEFESEEDAHEAYGFDMITEDEYENIRQYFENKEKFLENYNADSKKGTALAMLNDYVNKLKMEIRCNNQELKN